MDILSIAIFFSFGYEYFNLNYISKKNIFSFIDCLNEKIDTQFTKYRIYNESEIENNNDLGRCLL